MVKRWWTPRLTVLLNIMRHARRHFQNYHTPLSRTAWLEARREFYRAMSNAKQATWVIFVKELERVDIFKALHRLKECRSAIFSSICDPVTGNIMLFPPRPRPYPGLSVTRPRPRAQTNLAAARGESEGEFTWRPCLSVTPVELVNVLAEANTQLSPDTTAATSTDQSGSGAWRKRGGVHLEAMPLGHSYGVTKRWLGALPEDTKQHLLLHLKRKLQFFGLLCTSNPGCSITWLGTYPCLHFTASPRSSTMQSPTHQEMHIKHPPSTMWNISPQFADQTPFLP
ncbi:hypothetical protein C8R43DRAFT_1120742 [Mycena crocata]|nr:hypothetical protein C8R43DRAFT_1120742 [Mycena crocata]